jgi:hypothetical protein
MELVLNLAWMVLAALVCWLWVRYAPRKGPSRHMQIVAMLLIIAILFPAISMTDDLAMAQNAAETDLSQRRDHLCAKACSVHLSVADLTPAFSTETSLDDFHSPLPGNLLAPAVKVPALDSIQNRPPPAASSASRPR